MRKNQGSKKSLSPWVVVAACTFSVLAACSRGEADTAKSPVARTAPVEVTEVQAGPLDRSWDAVGSLMATESLMVRPEITGRIARIAVTEGQWVESGAVMFELDDAVVRAQLAQAEANLALARRNKTRADELFAGELIAPAERDTASAGLAASEAAASLARARQAMTSLRAPFRGRAGLRLVSVGDYVNPGQDLVRLEDVAQMKVEFRLPELALADLRVDQAVEVELDAFPGVPLMARVYALDSRVVSDTRSIAARATLDNADGRLRPGQFARVKLIVERKPAAIQIPEQALIARGDRNFVFVVTDGRAAEREVRVGQRQPGLAEIVEGLAAGEKVVTSGLQAITDGAAVQVAAAR